MRLQCLLQQCDRCSVSLFAAFYCLCVLGLCVCVCVCVSGWTRMVRKKKRGTFQRKSLTDQPIMSTSLAVSGCIRSKKMMSLSCFLSHILEKPVYCRSTKDLLLMTAYSTITASLLSGSTLSESRSGSFLFFFHPPTWCWIAGSLTNWMVLCVCVWSSASLHSPSSGQMLRIWWMLMRDATSFIIWYQSLCNWNSPGGWL